jgi:uncharacterized protein
MAIPRPGLTYAAERLFRLAFPKVTVTAPAPGIRFERDVAITLRDGTKLRANVFRPDHAGQLPTIMCAHPYGKDIAPLGRFRFLRTPDPITFSSYTSWEAPDPSFWVPRGYAVVNLDLRGFGKSEGTGTLFSKQEAEDYAEAIAWVAAQPWSSGNVGLNGVSYLAISQWAVAALRPRALAAICPWEGFSDVYRDVAYPGGVREDGFIKFWATMTERAGRTAESLRRQQLAHPEWDDFWASRTPDLERIEVPALICASFSDQGLHTRGSFEAFRRIGSTKRFLYTHRGGKWSTYYSAEALALQARFFDCFLKGEDNGMRDMPPVRLEVRESRREVCSVRNESAWPLPSTRWQKLFLAPAQLRESAFDASATVRFDVPGGRASFAFRVPEDMELAGPMKLRLHIELAGGTDAHLFVAVSKAREHEGDLPFEGSFGFGRDVVAKGWLRVAHRRGDDRAEPLKPGEIAPLGIEILPSATLFQRGDILRLVVQGRWFWRRNPFFGMFPGTYAPSPRATVIVHLGGAHDAHLLVPRTS